MRTLAAVLLVGFWLSACAAARSTPEAVVYIEILAIGESPENLERAVAIPLERSLNKVKAVKNLKSSMTQGTVRVEVGFSAQPTPEQVSRVKAAIAATSHEFQVTPTSIAVSVRQPSLP
jgi:multidrug efflux pump subunit AcrB